MFPCLQRKEARGHLNGTQAKEALINGRGWHPGLFVMCRESISKCNNSGEQLMPLPHAPNKGRGLHYSVAPGRPPTGGVPRLAGPFSRLCGQVAA